MPFSAVISLGMICLYAIIASNQINKKALRETQTLRAGCSKAEPNIFAPPQTPFLGARDGQNIISWRWSLPLPTDPVWWRSMHAISSYRGNRPTNRTSRFEVPLFRILSGAISS